jgi:putative transposase
VFFRPPVYRPGDVYLLAGDAVGVTQAGQHPDGLDRCFASLDSTVVPGLSCFARSLVSVQARRSVPIRVAQIVRRAAAKAASRAKAEAKTPPPSTTRRGPGRPKGRQNQVRATVTLTPALVRLRRLLDSLLPLITPSLPVPSLVLDGHFGHHHALPMAPQGRVPRSSKGRSDAALYGPDEGA